MRANEKVELEVMRVWEDMYELYRVVNGKVVERLASNLNLGNVTLFVSAWFSENFCDEESSLEIRRQPKEEEI